MHLLRDLQNKPYEYRIRMLYIGLAASFVVLILLWIATGYLVDKNNNDTENQGILNMIGGGFKNSREYWQDIMPKKP